MKKKESGLSSRRSADAMRIILTCVFVIYLITVLWYTVGRRESGYYHGKFDLFWSYKLWFDGEAAYGREILANIAMFVPFGFLFAALRKRADRKTILFVFLLSLAFSCLIEVLQITLRRGYFEYDDMINNVAGALLGAGIFWMFQRFLPERPLRGLLAGTAVGIFLVCLGVFLLSGSVKSKSVKDISQGMCLHIESADMADGRLEVTGVCFWYDKGPANYSIVLQSTRTGHRYPLETKCGLPRPDVSAYFHQKYMNAGFQATGQDILSGEEYEMILNFGFLRSISTGVYLTISQSESEPQRADIRFVPGSILQPLATEGNDLEEIANEGFLLSYNPAYHAYVYFYQGSLYWIADEGFLFEDDGSTRLELYLWTTETDKLPEKMRAMNREYELIGVYFESCELTGNFGPYRVCAKELPRDYPITSITTGYYSGGWVWNDTFWPVFDFSGI